MRRICYNEAMQKRLLRGRWLLAVSTGPDSMALLELCRHAGMDFAVGHVNYHHQQKAEEEEAFLRRCCAERHLELFVENRPFHPQGNFEAAARHWRYAFFARVVKENGLEGVVTAHQEDDLLETYFLQKESGRIPQYWGIAEETMIQGILVERPLLDRTKAQLKEYCDRQGIPYYLDETNQDTHYARNRIRQELVAPMDRFQRNLVREEIRQENAVWKERRCWVGTEIREERIDRSRYCRLEEEDRLTLLRMFLPAGSHPYRRKYLQQLDRQIRQEKDLLIPVQDRLLVSEQEHLLLKPPVPRYAYVVPDPSDLAQLHSPWFRIAPGQPGVNSVTVRAADYPLTIRTVQDGDAIVMRFGTKKVHRFFIDRRIPKYRRLSWPVVVNAAGKVILVPGLGCDVAHYSSEPDFSVLQ